MCLLAVVVAVRVITSAKDAYVAPLLLVLPRVRMCHRLFDPVAITLPQRWQQCWGQGDFLTHVPDVCGLC